MTLSERIRAAGPKRILALDGGGIRGIVTLEILARIESLLREKSKRQDFVLADYFDFIAGTSTGAIIGTALSLGMTVADIRNFYLDTGRQILRAGERLTPVPLQIRRSATLPKAPRGVRSRHYPRQRPTQNPGDGGDAQRHYGFALAGHE